MAGQTAIYGLSSMVGRFINYLLVFVHTRVLIPEQFGVMTGMYSYVSFLIIVFTYGMETAFFRFATKTGYDREKVFSTSLISLICSSVILFLLIAFFSPSIAGATGYGAYPQYITWFALILAADAITAIPFVNLRLEGKATRFVLFKLINIFLVVGFNLFFLVLCPYLLKHNVKFVEAIYHPGFGVGYVFLSNLIASVVTFLLLLPDILRAKFAFSSVLWKEMIYYALPLLPAGLAGMINETLDRILLIRMLPSHEALYQTGIYGANYKLAMLMTLFIQTFRYAAEPFFFAESLKTDAKKTYADVMKYFVIVCTFIFLGVTLYLDIVKGFIGKAYHPGLGVVPVLLLANLCLGIYINLSIWFKLTGQTRFGLYITILGAAITILLNYMWIPVYGYVGSAWATLICYFVMMLVCYFLGERYYTIPYNIPRILFYLALALVIYFANLGIRHMYAGTATVIALNSCLVLAYLSIIYYLERPKKIVP